MPLINILLAADYIRSIVWNIIEAHTCIGTVILLSRALFHKLSQENVHQCHVATGVLNLSCISMGCLWTMTFREKMLKLSVNNIISKVECHQFTISNLEDKIGPWEWGELIIIVIYKTLMVVLKDYRKGRFALITSADPLTWIYEAHRDSLLISITICSLSL